MRHLITGGLGQIGSHIAELLLARGDKVCVIDNLATGRIEHLKNKNNLKIVVDTISNRELINTLFQQFKPDCVIHAACSYKDPNDWYEDTLTNCVGATNVIKAALENETKRFIYFQTALCYGLNPISNPIRLNDIRNPEGSSYAISKTANELYLELSGLDYVTFRLANVIGPRNVAGPLPIFYKRLKDEKKCFVTQTRRDFVYVQDLAKIVVKACDGIGSGAYHFSSGKDIAILDLYNAVVKAMNLNNYPEPEIKPINDDDTFSILLDPQKTFDDFGYISFTDIDTTVRNAIEYYDKFGTLGEYTHLKLK